MPDLARARAVFAGHAEAPPQPDSTGGEAYSDGIPSGENHGLFNVVTERDMIDIHCHLLPAIDDGANNLEQALEMASMAVADGITHAVLTPHIQPGRWHNTAAGIAGEVAAFRVALEADQIPLKIGFAAEVQVSDQIFRDLEQEKIPFFGVHEGYRIMLLEFPHTHIVPGTDKLVAWLIRNGIRPLIAHPERNREINAHPEKLKPFLDQGCMAQITGASLTGRFGATARQAGEYFIRQGQVDVLASDAHNTTTRLPAMAAARDIVAAMVGADVAARMVWELPMALVAEQFQQNA